MKLPNYLVSLTHFLANPYHMRTKTFKKLIATMMAQSTNKYFLLENVHLIALKTHFYMNKMIIYKILEMNQDLQTSEHSVRYIIWRATRKRNCIHRGPTEGITSKQFIFLADPEVLLCCQVAKTIFKMIYVVCFFFAFC